MSVSDVIREVVATRLADIHKIVVPAPKVVVRAGEWIEKDAISKLDATNRSQAVAPSSANPRAAQIGTGMLCTSAG